MLEALDRGSPLYFAINTPSEMYARKVYISAGSGHTGGGHAFAIVGYKLDEAVEGGGYLLVKNSWGPTNGDHGYQWLAMGYCLRKGNYCNAWSIDRAGQP
jgi:C1A family cysteine protease